MDNIEIRELSNTFGCAWREAEGKWQYGFRGLPASAKLWLEISGGNAVNRLLEAELATVVGSRPGAYGGTVRTISVNVTELETVCQQYWERTNECEAAVNRDNCHYCGQRATGLGFFNEPICRECG